VFSKFGCTVIQHELNFGECLPVEGTGAGRVGCQGYGARGDGGVGPPQAWDYRQDGE